MPYGYVQYDSADFLLTPFRWLADHHYVIHSKKAFLSPTFFTLPFVLHIPALLFIPVAQHLMGLLEVFCAGLLVRLWFPMWRWIIVPATVLVAASPWQLWYEHTLMGEANYVFFLFVVAVAGTLWARRPTRVGFRRFPGRALPAVRHAGGRENHAAVRVRAHSARAVAKLETDPRMHLFPLLRVFAGQPGRRRQPCILAALRYALSTDPGRYPLRTGGCALPAAAAECDDEGWRHLLDGPGGTGEGDHAGLGKICTRGAWRRTEMARADRRDPAGIWPWKSWRGSH